VYCFVRRAPTQARELFWDPLNGRLDPNIPSGLQRIVNLAGEPIIGRWTEQKRERILESRVQGTRLLAQWIASKNEPRTFISASAIGIYGTGADDPCTEASPPGEGFLASVCTQWEMAADAARDASVRVVHPRIGLVLDPTGGALQKMLPAFRMGVGGPVGTGLQWNSWITLEDTVEVLKTCLEDERLSGPVNCVAPTPVQNKEFTKRLAARLHRPAFLPVPTIGLRMLFGRMADETLLASQRVDPSVLKTIEFAFRSPTLETAFKRILP
ncbi:MAG: TIGR01777 family oxidoreductase, partial [Bradymonadia bacterium]